MGKSWRVDGDSVDRFRIKQTDNWKKELHEEVEAMLKPESVFVIINEWTPLDSGEEISEITAGVFYLTENEAWEVLKELAEQAGITLDADDTSFEWPVRRIDNLSRDTYYIQELSRG